MVDNILATLEPPPRSTGNITQDYSLIITWLYKFYEAIRAFGTGITEEEAREIAQEVLDSATYIPGPSNLLDDDLRFPAQGINPPGLVSDPSIDSNTGLLLFAGNMDNVIAGIAQMPHKWAYGTPIEPHLHLRNPTANTSTSRWKFEYDIAEMNGNFNNAWGTYTELSTVSHVNPNDVLKHSYLSFGGLDMTGYSRSACIMWKISRLALSDAQDNDTSQVALLEFDIHYASDKGGTPLAERELI